jgi:hypothetical protein
MKNPIPVYAAKTEQYWHNFKKFWALRSLESDLSRILKIMTGHKNNKVPAGSSHYVALHNEAINRIVQFCTEYKVTLASIYTQIPALKELEDLAYPVVSSTVKKIAYAPLVIIGLSTLILFLGLFTHIIHWLFNFGYNLVR